MIKALCEPKPKIRINKKKLEEIRKGFYELRHKFSKKEIGRYRKTLYVIKIRRHSISEIKEAEKKSYQIKRKFKV